MPIDLKYGGRTFIKIRDPNGISGTTALGGYKLTFVLPIGVDARPASEQINLLSLFGRLSINNAEIGWMTPNYRVGIGTAITPADSTLQMAILLGFEQLDAAVRQIEPWEFKFELVGLANGPNGTQEAFGTGTFSIKQEDWNRSLAECGYANTINIWVRIPKNQNESLNKASSALGEAQLDARQDVSAAGAVAKCRIALESTKLSGSGLNVQIGDPPKKHEDLTFEERRKLLYMAIHRFTSPPHHRQAPEYGRAEARLSIALTAALIEYAAERDNLL
jgi:hypothetical protein